MDSAAKLLVVDDEEVVCESCARILEGEGFKVETVTDSREALRKTAETEYAAILLDVMIPGMDGLEFLAEFRRNHGPVPVLLITGYPSVETAAAAMRLGASDYVQKPFTPDEITAAVRRIVEPRRSEVSVVGGAVVAARPAAEPWVPAGPEVRFAEGSWLQMGRDGTARVGTFLPRSEVDDLTGVTLPYLGDTLWRGLPMASLRLRGLGEKLVAAPLSGRVCAVSSELEEHPARAMLDPCRSGWIARIQPRDPVAEAAAASVRAIVLASADELRSRRIRAKLVDLGCSVAIAGTRDETVRAVEASPTALLLVDEASIGRDASKLVGLVRERRPATKIIALGDTRGTGEAALRSQRLFYYAIDPFTDYEILDLLRAAFPEPAEPNYGRTRASGPAQWVRRVEIQGREGRPAAAICGPRLLKDRAGVGEHLIQSALGRSLPVEVGLGSERMSAKRLFSEIEQCDRVVVLEVEDMHRIPGTMERNRPSELLEMAGRLGEKVVTLTVQPPDASEFGMTFDARTDRALAALVLRELGA